MSIADVDDLAAAARDHVRSDCLADVVDAVEVGRHEFAPVFVRELLERRPALNAGVVHQNIERAGPLLEGADRTGNGRGIRHVETADRDLCAALAQPQCSALERSLGAPVEDDFGTGLGQCHGDRQSNTTPRAGHQRASARQAEQVQAPPEAIKRSVT
jgi:hypothetical protein